MTTVSLKIEAQVAGCIRLPQSATETVEMLQSSWPLTNHGLGFFNRKEESLGYPVWQRHTGSSLSYWVSTVSFIEKKILLLPRVTVSTVATKQDASTKSCNQNRSPLSTPTASDTGCYAWNHGYVRRIDDSKPLWKRFWTKGLFIYTKIILNIHLFSLFLWSVSLFCVVDCLFLLTTSSLGISE